MIQYKPGYKYVLQERVSIQLIIQMPHQPNDTAAVVGPGGSIIARLSGDGVLTIEPGYAWDGPSGPAIDTPDFMGASLVHDTLYQMIRLGLLPHDWRAIADDIMHRLCLGAGMSRIRAWWCWVGVRKGAWYAALPSAERPVKTAELRFPEGA